MLHLLLSVLEVVLQCRMFYFCKIGHGSIPWYQQWLCNRQSIGANVSLPEAVPVVKLSFTDLLTCIRCFMLFMLNVFRVMMKKEVHQKTTESSDGREITVIKEESNVHHDADPPEELRESMQQIIDQFLSNDPDVPMIAAEEKDTAADDDKGTQV